MKQKKKFKNSFGVAGTQTEINQFKKEAEFIGWKFQPNEEKDPYHLCALWFNSKEKGESLKRFSFWHRRGSKEMYNIVEISTIKGWDEAIRLASELQQEEPITLESLHKRIKYLEDKN